MVAMLMSVLILLSCTAPAALAAHQSVTDWEYGFCNTAQFSSNDTFAANVNAVTESLTRNSSKTLYSSASSHTGSESNDVFAIYQCRGDVSLSDCALCVHTALSSVATTCGYHTRGVRLQYKGCYIRYENYPFASGLDHAAPKTLCSTQNDSSPVYQHNILTALNITASAAPKHALFGYNSSSAGTSSSTRAYALTQCLGYLSDSECATCLSAVSNYSGECRSSVSGGVFFVPCYYLYGNASLLFTYNNSTSGTANLPPSRSSPINASPTQERSSKKSKSSTGIIVGVVVGASLAFATIIVLVLCCLIERRKKAVNPSKLVEKGLLMHVASTASDQGPELAAGATRFSLKELRESTLDFSPTKKLGQGGFGPVYQGTLKAGRDVAIKMLSVESRQGKAQFINEVNLITTVQHRNLVELIGYCVEECNRLLVYEHLPNRSLDLHLFDVDEKKSLHWHTRLKIIVGIARGLTYLHQDSHLRIVHRDIKASNILLDDNLDPKIEDFGLARLFGDDMSHLTTKVVGTLGYLAPEYAMGGQLSEKADVYSFGVVALEIVSGRRVLDNENEQNLLEWTWALYEKMQQLQIVDKRMQKDVNEWEVVRVVHVALLCTQSQPHLRPSMCDVYSILNNESNILDLPTKPITMGMFTSGLSSTRPSSISECSQADYSVNTVPVSEVQPR